MEPSQAKGKILVDAITSNPATNVALDTVRIGKQALVFVGTRQSAEKSAEEIAAKLKISDGKLKELADEASHALPKPTKQCERLARCIKGGTAFHHSGLTAKQRQLVEDNFRSGLIKIICCTPTLCVSKYTKLWHGTSETEVFKLKTSHPLFVLSKGKLISMKAQKVQRIDNPEKLIQISSVSGYTIKVTPNHKMFIKRNNQKMVLEARLITKKDKIATAGKLNVSDTKVPSFNEFVTENKLEGMNYKFDTEVSYLIGAMLGDGYSGAETINGKIRYKGSPALVGIDQEIFSLVLRACLELGLTVRKSRNYHGTPQLVLGKNNWFREFLARCGVEKGDKKYISDKLMVMSLGNVSWLLKGLFDTDGYVNKNRHVGFSNISEKLIQQMQKLLLRFGIVSRIRRRKESSMEIYGKEYRTKISFELTICQKSSIIDFYKFIGFNVKRKQKALTHLITKINSNVNYVTCAKCNYKIYSDLFSGRSAFHKKWGKIKLEVIKLLGKKGELGSRQLRNLLNFEARKNEKRLNHHYELIIKRRTGSRATTEWFWSLNRIGEWVFANMLNKNADVNDFFKLNECPICNSRLDLALKKGWRDSDFEGDIFWDIIREIKESDCEKEVYDVVLPSHPENAHMFVANGFIVHNSA
ncbi:MAG TPA: LAGLIDADG family homing endonuclease, partial [Candidatus Nanoarchaeia archaeon]|nr:LAGLIDADG family homing endonuclease [Candidatus Nanoarchaeia archaeon]